MAQTLYVGKLEVGCQDTAAARHQS